MNRAQLEHLIRASADIADDDEIVVVGSQAVLGQFPDAPAQLLISQEADVFPRNRPERWNLIDGSIGELSPFHHTFGYYAQGVEEQTALLPQGWKDRLIPIQNQNTRGATGWCLEIHDLAISKYAAGREKDHHFNRTVAEHGLADYRILLERLAATCLGDQQRQAIRNRLNQDFGPH